MQYPIDSYLLPLRFNNQAKRADLAIDMYKEHNQWEDAIRVAKQFMPSKVPDIHAEFATNMKR